MLLGDQQEARTPPGTNLAKPGFELFLSNYLRPDTEQHFNPLGV